MNELFKTLGDINRLRILNLLMENSVCVCEIENILKLSQTNVSRHLGKLKNSNIVSVKKKAQWNYYEIDKRFKKNNSDLINYLILMFSKEKLYKKDLTMSEKYLEESCDNKACCNKEKKYEN